jgi:hypothetical protein
MEATQRTAQADRSVMVVQLDTGKMSIETKVVMHSLSVVDPLLPCSCMHGRVQHMDENWFGDRDGFLKGLILLPEVQSMNACRTVP